MSFSRTLTFRSDATIVTPLTIMLTFDKVDAVPALQQIAWRIINFGGPNQFATVTYQQTLMFASVQINDGQEVTAEANTAIAIGQQTSLVNNGPGVVFTPPTTGNAGQLIATNHTGTTQGIAIGFLDANDFPNPLLVWPTVGNTNSVEAVFTPTISAYATADFQQTQLITGEIVSPVLLNQNLALLPSSQLYTVKMNPDGSFSIVADQLAAAPIRPKIKFDPRFEDYHVGKPNAISVANNTGSTIHVRVGCTTSNGSDRFYALPPGTTEHWTRGGSEIISVNVGGAGRVANFYGILGKTLQINSA